MEEVKREKATTFEIQFETDLLDLFYKRFAKAAKKYAKLGQELRIVGTREEVVMESRVIGGKEFEEEIHITHIEIERPSIDVRPGVVFWGTISLTHGTKTIYRTEECPDDVVLAELELICDHCNVNRKRNKYFVFQEDGRLMRLGSTCVQPYFGLNLERILKCFDGIMDGLGEPVPQGGGRRDLGWGLGELIIGTEYVCAKGKWIPAGVSSNAIRSILIQSWRHPHEDASKKFIAFCRSQVDTRLRDVESILEEKYKDPQDDFGWGIYNALFTRENGEDASQGRLRSRIASKASGLACFAIYQALFGDYRRRGEKKEETPAPSNNGKGHIGNKGEKVTLKVKATQSREIDTEWGGAILIGFEDEKGNRIKWFYSGRELYFTRKEFSRRVEDGGFFTIQGTVKKHGEYRGEPETHLTRVKVL